MNWKSILMSSAFTLGVLFVASKTPIAGMVGLNRSSGFF